MIIAATGHRPNKLNNEYDGGPVTEAIKSALRTILKSEKPDGIISGMALGVDTIFALLGLEMNIPVIAAVPFIGQERVWPATRQKMYRNILSQCNDVKYVSDITSTGYAIPAKMAAKLMNDRNKWMVDNSDKIIAVWDGTPGGTENCVKYAVKCKKPGWRVYPGASHCNVENRIIL